jgi:hypothetical protein
MRLLILSILCASTCVLAFSKGSKLYVKANDTVLHKQPGGQGPQVAKLHAGTAVIWNGASEKDQQWHEVSVDGKRGFVQLQDLSPHERAAEIDAVTGKPLNVQAFASLAAAMKVAHYKGSGTESAAAAELIYLEELNKLTATPAALASKNKELHTK